MSRQPNRLAADAAHGFGGAELDRGKPLSFRLDGRTIGGFAGDTLLSAVLAAGIDTAGRRGGETIALDEAFSPAVAPAAAAGDPARALPMDRTPALPGLELVTLGAMHAGLATKGLPGRLRRLLLGPGHSLQQRLDGSTPLHTPWLHLPPETMPEVDTVVVGGGLAGMSAALAAAAAGERVALLERRPLLGGDARFFGGVGDEEPPDAAVRRLAGQLSGADNITVLLRAEVFAIEATGVRAHQVELRDGSPVSRVVALRGKRLVLATGAGERLPVFPGNRTPGVSGAVAAFHRADRYGVWLGRRALFSTTRNSVYRLAMLAKDAGVDVQRIVDTRLNPQSRFIDFTKASGITSASGLILREVLPARQRLGGLSVGFAVAIDDIDQDTAPLATDQVVAAGGWQPNLALWLLAGGQCGWNAETSRLEWRGGADGVALAGAVAGYSGHAACQESGRAAVAQLLGRRPIAVADPQIEAIYETPDGSTPVAPQRNRGRGLAYLDHGRSLTTRQPALRTREPDRIFGAGRALSLGDVAAAVQIGALPEADAGVVAGERCLGAGDIADTGWRVAVPPPAPAAMPAVPPYLAGRFGPKQQLAIVAVPDRRFFETGCLMFASSETSDPHAAIGVIIGPAPGGRSGGVALTGRLPDVAGARFFVRDSSGPVPVQLMERLKAEG